MVPLVAFFVVLTLLQGLNALHFGSKILSLPSLRATSSASLKISVLPSGPLGLRRHAYSSTARFSSRAPSSSGGSGGTALDTRVEQKTSTKIRDEIEKNWRLILHDDTIHTIQQVCDIVSANCPLCPGPRAYEVTMEVHMTGAGTVCVANKKIVSEYTKKLQAAGLTVSMAADEDFESGGE